MLCGCQPATSNSDHVTVHWHQQVYGSSANRSQLFFAALHGDDAVDAARQCGLSVLGDSLTAGVRLSAGESGSSDSLRVERPNAPPLALGGTCHDWASPFELEGRWRPFGSDEGYFDLQDGAGRALRVVQHGFDAEAGMICLGIKRHARQAMAKLGFRLASRAPFLLASRAEAHIGRTAVGAGSDLWDIRTGSS